MIGPSGHLFDLLREYFHRYGYWTVAVMLLVENTGVPVPGETTLLFAAFLAYSEHQLRLPIIIAFGIVAAVLGDNTGYAIGHFGGRRFVDRYLRFLHVSRETAEKGEAFFDHHGAVTIFFARFIAGLRVIAGPLAGTLQMPWSKFLLFNFLGAVAWVTVIAAVGYFFGSQLDRLLRAISHVNLVILAVVLIAVGLWYWRRRRRVAALSKRAGERRAA